MWDDLNFKTKRRAKVEDSQAVENGMPLFSVSDSLQLRRVQHGRLPCPSVSPRVGSDSWPLSRWRQPTISSSVVPFSSCRQSFPASGSFPVSQLLSDGQSIMALATVLKIIQGWFPLGSTGQISLLSRDPQESSPAPQFNCTNFSALNLLYDPTLTFLHDYWKNHSFDYTDLCWQSNVSTV